MKTKNNGNLDEEIKRIQSYIESQKEEIEKLDIIKGKDYYISNNHEIFVLNNKIKSGKLRVIHNWKADGIVVCDKIYNLGQYKVYDECALLYSLSKNNFYDYTKHEWDSTVEGFINKDCPDYFDFFNRNNATLRRALNNFSKTSLYENNSNEIPGWLQDYFILM